MHMGSAPVFGHALHAFRYILWLRGWCLPHVAVLPYRPTTAPHLITPAGALLLLSLEVPRPFSTRYASDIPVPSPNPRQSQRTIHSLQLNDDALQHPVPERLSLRRVRRHLREPSSAYHPRHMRNGRQGPIQGDARDIDKARGTLQRHHRGQSIRRQGHIRRRYLVV